MHNTTDARSWRIRELDLGRVSFEVTLQGGIVVRFEIYHGGGFVASHGMWRVAGRLVGIVEAGES